MNEPRRCASRLLGVQHICRKDPLKGKVASSSEQNGRLVIFFARSVFVVYWDSHQASQNAKLD